MIRYTGADPGNLKGGSFTSAATPALGHTHCEAAHRVPFQVILYNSTLTISTRSRILLHSTYLNVFNKMQKKNLLLKIF